MLQHKPQTKIISELVVPSGLVKPPSEKNLYCIGSSRPCLASASRRAGT
jgi:hypothetical protein